MTRFIVLAGLGLALIGAGCASTAPDAASNVHAPPESPMTGRWVPGDSLTGAVVFLPSGLLVFEQGTLLASINRLQNTERRRYISRLRESGRYEVTADDTLVLHVTADWTGKGAGARRPADRLVESRIVFDIVSLDDERIQLEKNEVVRGEAGNLNAGDELTLVLVRHP